MKSKLRIGHFIVGNHYTFGAFAECMNCGHLFPTPERGPYIPQEKRKTAFIDYQRRVAVRLADVRSTRPQRRRLEKAIVNERPADIVKAAAEIGPEVKQAVAEAQRLGWGKRGVLFVLRYLKLTAACF